MNVLSAHTRMAAIGLALAFVFAGSAAPQGTSPPGHAGLELTALDRYVRAPDPAYRYELVKTIEGQGVTGYVLDMVSQVWLTEEEVSQPEWRHWLVVVKPDRVDTNKALLSIWGGDHGDEAPSVIPPRLKAFATATNSVTAQLYGVPNQPLTFLEEGSRMRYEDAIIAYTWDRYLRTGDEKWPLRLPMTKSAVRAMDTMTAFCASDAMGNLDVDQFVVAGASKRGWTTWTTAAVDRRVIAIMPLVIDLLNIEPSFRHHYEVYGFYAPAVGDYVAMDLMEWTGAPEYRRLMEIVEPYEYRKRLALPKYMVSSLGDQFFLPDSSRFYFDELDGEKYLRSVPNTDHGLGGSDVVESLVAWYHSVVKGVPRPRFTWRLEEDGAIRVFTLDEPSEVRLWQASNEEARDFRKETIGEAWSSTVLAEEERGVYVGRVPVPEKGWTAYMVELTYPSGTAVPFKFTTVVHVLPDETPFTFEERGRAAHAKGFLETD